MNGRIFGLGILLDCLFSLVSKFRLATRIITDDFLSLNPYTEAYKSVRHIVIDSTDMKTGVVNPVDYIDFENEGNYTHIQT